ncbi:MAG: glycosyltransferase family 2 protein [Candidatus Omnitrophica bacterium]|nr:glycosyltransferase family 2 protein [Candidatus Omnitrophota bacterium]
MPEKSRDIMDIQPKLSIIIPIYNEERLLPEVLQRIRSLEWANREIILVNDCSTDTTEAILEPEKKKSDTVVLTHSENLGKGAAIRTGLRYVTGDIVIIQDADMEYDPAEIVRVIEPIAQGEVKVCFGSRFMGSVKDMRLPNRVGNWLLAQMVSWLFGQRITDEATAYKAFHRSVIDRIPLECHGFEFCPEVTSKVLKLRYKILEVPVTFKARTVAEGKKIGWRDFIVAVWTILKVRLFWSPKKATPAIIPSKQ